MVCGLSSPFCAICFGGPNVATAAPTRVPGAKPADAQKKARRSVETFGFAGYPAFGGAKLLVAVFSADDVAQNSAHSPRHGREARSHGLTTRRRSCRNRSGDESAEANSLDIRADA
jgi:hypothetical protein